MKPAVERIAAVVVWAASLAPLWTWWVRRFAEPIDIDVVAWTALVLLVIRDWWCAAHVPVFQTDSPAERVLVRGPSDRRTATNPATGSLLLAAAGLAAFHLLRGAVPPTASGAMAILCGVTLLLPAGASAFPYLGLAFMGLPTMMILDLFLGLPLRSVATATAVALLEFAGLPVVQTGLEIAVGGTSVWVDVPCAGVHMLGAGALTAFVLAALFRFNWWRTALLAAAALFAVLVANVARIVALTAFALRGTELSQGAHSAVGCVLLLPSILALAILAQLISGRRK